MEGEFLINPIRQILIVARTEFRFAFHRSAPVVTTALVGLLVNAGIMILLWPNLASLSVSLTLTPEQQANWIAGGFKLEQYIPFLRNSLSEGMVLGSTLPWLLMLLALLFLPAATISAIPADRVFGVAELLRSTPLSGARYIAGKLAGQLLAVFLVAAAMLGFFFAGINILFFAYLHFSVPWSASLYFIELSLLDGTLLLAWGTVVGVLTGVFFHTRRAAIFPGLIAGGLSILFWVTAFRPPNSDASLPIADRLEYYLLQNYTFTLQAVTRSFGIDLGFLGFTQRVGFSQVAGMFLTVLAALAILTILARLWLQWKENF